MKTVTESILPLISQKLNPLFEGRLEEKLKKFAHIEQIDLGWICPKQPERDIETLNPSRHPKKKGLSFIEGQQRLLHDLCSIELQAAELCLRTLIEFQNRAPRQFLTELLGVAGEEAEHCGLCLKALKDIGGHWGMFPCHLDLWNTTACEDTLLERILKVHRYLEGSGVDAGFTLLNKIQGVPGGTNLGFVVKRISEDEIRHVKFGSLWFKRICQNEGKIPFEECRRILFKFRKNLPHRRENINTELRILTGFCPEEIRVFKEFQQLKNQSS